MRSRPMVRICRPAGRILCTVFASSSDGDFECMFLQVLHLACESDKGVDSKDSIQLGWRIGGVKRRRNYQLYSLLLHFFRLLGRYSCFQSAEVLFLNPARFDENLPPTIFA